MRRLRARKSLALFGVAVVLAAMLSVWASPDAFAAILTPLWFVSAAIVVAPARQRPSGCGEQLVAFLAVLPARAPPAGLVFA